MKVFLKLKHIWRSLTEKVAFFGKLFLRVIISFFIISFYVAPFIGLVSIMLWINNQVVKPTSEHDQSILLNFLILWQGLLYTLILGGIGSILLTKFEKINSAIVREVDELARLLQTSRMCNNKNLSDELIDVVENYINYVRVHRHKDHRTNPTALEKIMKIQNCVEKMIGSSNVQEFLKPELLHHYKEIYSARKNRVELIEQKMHPVLWSTLVIISLALLWGIFWLEFDNVSLGNYILGLAVFLTAYFFFFARDLDDLKSGFWRMDFEPFDTFDFKSFNHFEVEKQAD